MKRVTTFLWFNDQAEEAATFYASVFKGEIVDKMPGPGGKAMSATGSDEGQNRVRSGSES